MIHLLTHPGTTGRETLAEYQSRGGYRGLAKVLEEGAAWLIDELDDAGLRGRGGSGRGSLVAPKWRKVARSGNKTRYVIANGAEGSPVSKKDRYLMTHFPHRILEGALAAAYAVNAAQVYLYVRGDSEESLSAMKAALAEAKLAGLVKVDVYVQPSIASYISGEETAVIDALEGLEGLPQPKPPHPEELGFRGCPTIIANVETFAAAAAIVREGVSAFRSVGTPDCPGTALFTVTGDVEKDGVYEVPYGTSLKELLTMAGAPTEVTAVLPGGLGNGPLGPTELDIPLTYEDLAEAGTGMGNAAVVVVGTHREIGEFVTENVAFLADASCGQCKGCKNTTRQLADLLAAGDKQTAADVAELLMYAKGNCAHPTGAAKFALRSLRSFADSWR